jgi:SAM-dependent methyltransferase
MTVRNCVTFLLVVLSATAVAWSADKPASSTGLKGEQSLPNRQPYVVEDALRLCRPGKGFWVDLGAGQGQVALALIEKGHNPVLMIDPKTEVLDRALQTARERGWADRAFAITGRAENLPLLDNSVDFLVSRGSIFFWEDPVKGLQEVRRVLRPGGKAYIGGGAGSGYPKQDLAKLLQARNRKRQGEDAEKWNRFVELRRPEQMQQWARKAGLPEFQILGRGALSADDPRVGQGVWLLFEKK